MVNMLTFDEAVALVASKPEPLLVAIDGLPLSGKTTLALRLVQELGAECLSLDDFVRPRLRGLREPSHPVVASDGARATFLTGAENGR